MAAMASPTFVCCSFCPTEKKEIYTCPKCKQPYCSIRCYRSKRHSECSEAFYKEQCEREINGGEIPNNAPEKPINRPNVTFEEFMKEQEAESSGASLPNPQIEVGANEQILFDSDDEPDYLLDVVNSTMDQFKSMDMDELHRKMLAAGVSPFIGDSTMTEEEKMEKLYANLNDDERKTFSRLANEMFENTSGIMDSCFAKKRKT